MDGDFPNKLRLYRRRCRYLQIDVAQFLDVKSTAEISRWEKGKLLPGTTNLLTLSIIYNAPIEELYGNLILSLKDKLSPRQERFVSKAKIYIPDH